MGAPVSAPVHHRFDPDQPSSPDRAPPLSGRASSGAFSLHVLRYPRADAQLLRAVAHEGYTEPTPVQLEAIPLVLDGRDVLAGAQTGTGKTAAFVLPMLQLLHGRRPAGAPNGSPDRRDATRPPIRALILTPTRELALQVEESVRTYGAARPIRSTTIYGGVGFDPQVRALRAGPEIVVATPGRLLDHLSQRTIDLSRVEILVLDEADRMLDMGFIRDIRKVLAVLPPKRQNLLFSATFSDEIRRLADGFLERPAHVQVTPRNTATELVTQVVHPVDRERKRELLSYLITSGRIDQALVFTRTKHGANRLALQLEKDGIKATAIHGNKSQPQRVRALADFKAGRYAVLVATEIAARGLDIDALPHVVNYELPMVPEDYVHRIGRTGRAERDGDAVSLVCVDELEAARRDRKGPRPEDPDRDHRRLRAGSAHPTRADPPWRPRLVAAAGRSIRRIAPVSSGRRASLEPGLARRRCRSDPWRWLRTGPPAGPGPRQRCRSPGPCRSSSTGSPAARRTPGPRRPARLRSGRCSPRRPHRPTTGTGSRATESQPRLSHAARIGPGNRHAGRATGP